MAPRPQSRIEVDLKLLEDKNVEKLKEFGKQFDQSIDKLATMLGTYSEQVAGAEGMARRAGKLSPEASVASEVKITGPPARSPGGWSSGGSPSTGGGFNYSLGGSGEGSYGFIPAGGGGAGGGGGSPDDYERQYIEATRRIGEIPVGLRQTLGYMAAGQLKIPFVSEDASKAIAEWGNERLFQMGAVRANANLAYGKMGHLFNSIMVPTQAGMDLGRSRSGGLFGTGLFSSAWKTGMMENLKTAWAADFGFNPNYSMADAAAARQATQGLGYSGNTADVINEQLKQLKIHQNLDPGSVMSMLDPLMRYGNANQNGGQLIDVLRAIPEAANAAGFNLKVFTEQLTNTSLQIAQQTGMQPGQVASALSSFSATTGLSPEKAAGLFDPKNLTLAAAMTGKTMTQLMEHPSAAPMMQFGLKVFQGMTGMSAEELIKLRRRDPKKYNQVMDAPWRMYLQNKEIFGGFSPLELLNMQERNRGRTVQHTAVDQAIRDQKLGEGSVAHIESLMKDYGPHSKNLVREFEDWRTKTLRDGKFKNEADFRAQARDKALAILGDNQKKQGRRAAVQITLTPEAQRFFKILEKNTGQQDTPGRNALGSWWRRANNYGWGDLGHDTKNLGESALHSVESLF